MVARHAVRTPARPAAVNPLREKLKQGLAQQKAGNIEKALRIYKAVLKKSPANADALHLAGVCYRQLGYPKRAVEMIERAIKLSPNQAAFHANLGRAKSDLPGISTEEILGDADMALTLDPRQIEARNLKAITLTKLDRKEEAEQLFQDLILDQPNYTEAYRNYGVLLRDDKQFDKALVFFNKAALLEPHDVRHFVDRARCRLELQDYDNAEAELAVALERFPNDGEVQHEISRLMFALSRNLEGIPYGERAVKDDPDNYHRHVTLGVHYLMIGDPEKALKSFGQAKRLTKDQRTNIDWNIALTFLALGDLEKGWDLHPSRFVGVKGVIKRTFNVPVWRGEDISDKTILVWTDQGLGDTVRYGTLLPELQEQAGQIIYEGPPKSLDIFRRAFPDIECRRPNVDKTPDYNATLEDYDFQIPIADLPRFYRRSFDNFKTAKRPVYTFDREKAVGYLERLGVRADGPIVGVAWRSKNLDVSRARYYMSAPQFQPVLKVDGVTYINLQYKCVDREITFLETVTDGNFVNYPDVDLFDDLDSVLALTAICDLVVTSNISVGELTGVLDIPCVRFGPVQTSVLLGQENPPWYPSCKYIRIRPDKESTDVLGDLVGEVEKLAANFDPGPRLQRLGLKPPE